ncbi:MAG: PhzF family phenazine biosynthesis protein [Rhodoferax sp.]|uniref:PhzF family phenazine biosynthesis protein n=1 Tax=Rhodoferax sp. TaxID=50421 RepID=UPI0026260340|nr:PhzF family phenazine biosynthesis protein [Rhodoferax sp.]MDD2880922.1 PhzF family phenazine biosynthesis protein [Rhodoferax sp.]
MKLRAFKQVDVFTDTPYLGNPLAVVLDGSGLSTEDMQHFACWTNLSETTFLLPPTPEAAAAGADYQVRIFTTAYEMPFAGHPTLGSCHAWLEAGGQPKHPEFIVQQCPVGLVRIRHSAKPIAFAAPALTRRQPTPDTLADLTAALGLSPAQLLAAQHLNNGPSHFGMLINSGEALQLLAPDPTALRAAMLAADISGIGLAVIDAPESNSGLIKRSNREARAFAGHSGASAEAAQLSVRFFFNTGVTVLEDPVTGSFNASLAQWLMAEGLAPTRYTATQGTCLGRMGQVHLSRDAGGQVWVGGDSVTCIDGTVRL